MSNEEFNSPAGGGARVSRRQFFKAGGLFAGTALFAGEAVQGSGAEKNHKIGHNQLGK